MAIFKDFEDYGFPKSATEERKSETYRWLFEYASSRPVLIKCGFKTLIHPFIATEEDTDEEYKIIAKNLKEKFRYIRNADKWLQALFNRVMNNLPCN